MARFAFVLISSFLTLGLAVSAQTIQVSRDNKTIYVTSEGEAKAEPEIAILTLGYHARSKAKDALYDETATVSDEVLATLIRAGVKTEMIRTDKTSLTHVEAEPNWPADWKANRVFEAELRWKAEASKNALGRARTVADSMALALGTKLGALVYASNSPPIRPSNWPFFSGLNTSTASVSSVIGTLLPPKIIKLLPQKITEKTTVYAVFAIE